MKTLSFGETRKIKKRGEISRLFKEGRRWECPCFVVIYERSGLPRDRLGVIVSKRTGNAVERNRVKRVFREVFRCGIWRNPPFFDILVKPRPMPGFLWKISEQRGLFDKWQDEAKSKTRFREPPTR